MCFPLVSAAFLWEDGWWDPNDAGANGEDTAAIYTEIILSPSLLLWDFFSFKCVVVSMIGRIYILSFSLVYISY